MSVSPMPAAGLSTAGLRVRAAAMPSLRLDLDLLPAATPLLRTEEARACPIAVAVGGRLLAGDDFRVTSLFEAEDSLIATLAAGPIEARLAWNAGLLGALHMIVQVRAAGLDTPCDAELQLPILRQLQLGDPACARAHDPGLGPVGNDGQPLVRTGDYPLPYSYWSDGGGVAILARFARDTIEASRWQSVCETMPVRLRSEWVEACELIYVACDPGWLGAFRAVRDLLRAGVDLSEYCREDLSWYRQQWLQHFTFLYGSEIFDHARQCFDLARLIEDGQRFGGYDGLLLWPQYPRIGVDERDQWAFYDDLPGGRPGLRELAVQARASGTRVFVPYLPWDTATAGRRSRADAARELAQVIADIGADGVFLDTIGNVHPQFRRAIDRVRPGVVFCSEKQPGPGAVELITGSWDQAEHSQAGEVDLQRFLFPEHPSFMINRHAVGAQRQRVIQQALFNGTGLVVWQDVFGEILPYTAGEAAQIRGVVGILRRHETCFRGSLALPLVPVARTDLLANAFVAADGRATVTVYNAGEEPVSGDLVTWEPAAPQHWVRVDERGSMPTMLERPAGTLTPGEVAVYTGAPGASRLKGHTSGPRS